MDKGGNKVKISNTSKRLKSIMNSKNLKQVDILKLAEPYCHKYDVKLKKNDLSQYVSGKVEPGQNKLFILALALNVSEAWLMGYDVPMEKDFKSKNIDVSTHFKISSHERELVVAYREHPESQPVIDKILDIDKPKTFKVMTAARSADGRTEIRDIEMTAEEVKKLDNIPETDEQF